MLPAILKPAATYALTRLGRDQDGGYLVEESSIGKAMQLVSCGLGNDWSFEEDFLAHGEVPLRVYDHTVSEKAMCRKILRSSGIRRIKNIGGTKGFSARPAGYTMRS